MSTLRNLPKTEWRGFFDRMSKPLLGKWARHPTAITVEEAPTGLASVAVVDAEGARHVVRLRDPLALPPATAA